jgi:transcriptional regulator with XRE-family HTH domain
MIGGEGMLTVIKRARLLKGIRQKEFAEMLGVSQVTVSNWERGVTFPDTRRMQQVAKTLDIPVEQIIDAKLRVG